ncbi:MAG TPA: glycosyltransferase [Candidatus Babeliales bacterium]|nr:glycosyltransferase [Candidatus Babeliales bacterium]
MGNVVLKSKKLHYFCSLFFFCTTLLCASVPKISIITSVYKGDQYIAGFMEDIVSQTIFDQCELIMIDANSPDNECQIIKKYMEQYSNIIYLRFDHDPGLYAVWNMAIAMAGGAYITNANLDDRLKFDCYEKHAQTLDMHTDVDLVYSDFYVTYYPNETFICNRYSHVRTMAEFSPENMVQPLPNNHPMWRKSLHDRCGYFDTTYRYVADYEFWLRAVGLGAIFMKAPGIYGLYYFNPQGVSTNSANGRAIRAEEARIYVRYSYLFK